MTDDPKPIAALADTGPVAPPRSQWRDVWDQFRSHRGALIGSLVLLAIIAGVFLGPLVWPYDASFIDIRARNQGPSLAHPFGTDQLGRDTLARMMAGGQTSIAVGLSCTGLQPSATWLSRSTALAALSR